MIGAPLAAGQSHVAFGDRADARIEDADAHLVGRQAVERIDDRFDRSLHVRLDDERHFLDRRSVGREHVLEADRRRGRALLVEHALAIVGDFAGAGLVLDDRERIAG